VSKYTVLATPRSFAKQDPQPLTLLESRGCQVIRLPIHDGDLREQLWEYLPQADGIIAGLESYDASLLERAKKLKVISRYGVGVDNVDISFTKARNIVVTNTPGANSDSVADLAVALMLCAARHVCQMNQRIHAGQEKKPLSGVEMWKKTLGIVGTGRIGKGVIARVGGFKMNVLAYDAYPDEGFMSSHNGKYVDLDTLFSESDFISLHAPLNEDTKSMVNQKRIALMKKDAILVNTARGGLIDEDALFNALKNGLIGAAALDALMNEPASNSPLASLENCILTPHAGAATLEAGLNMGMMAAQNLLDVLEKNSCRYALEL
jgi:D-3-phosphoglycerate dehydrogenase